MKLTICSIGRLKPSPEKELQQKYIARIRWPLEIVELEVKKKLPPPVTKLREAVLLTGSVPRGAMVVALDQRGQHLSSQDFAGKLGGWRDQDRDAAFLIGGASGLEKRLRDEAHLVIAFGTATWPHMLIRIMLIEQIYRAQEILAGNPYHRD
ncbi:MAG: 23S rRNA (pseudouridine(1915)-N(3))-methyltransferase RlmH [Pseudomonadota bacterium]|nr:23S rRNA (pseudouridine(1915)-N(3))-methyltransferase RlmH [Pseudomonadota bacterium]